MATYILGWLMPTAAIAIDSKCAVVLEESSEFTMCLQGFSSASTPVVVCPRATIAPFIREVFDFDPPLETVWHVWRRTYTGRCTALFGSCAWYPSRMNYTPWLKVAGADVFVRMEDPAIRAWQPVKHTPDESMLPDHPANRLFSTQ
jgi:hypothetical protein